MKKSFLLLTMGRLGLFLLCAILVWVVSDAFGEPLNGLPLLLIALLVSSPLGYLLLTPQRRAAAEALQARHDAKAEQAAARRARIENES